MAESVEFIFSARRQKILLEMREMLIDTKKEKAPIPNEYMELMEVINRLIAYEAKFLAEYE